MADPGQRRSVDLRIPVEDVTGLAGAEVALTIWLPEKVPATGAVVCFGFPGGGYSRRYFSFDLPGETGDGQAGYHVDRGWIFVTLDHLGVGESTVPQEFVPYEMIAAYGHQVVTDVTTRLAEGSPTGGQAVENPTILGIGQSMGCYFLVVQQAQRRSFDGLGVLGASAIHTVVPTRPGEPPLRFPWTARSTAGSSSPLDLNPDTSQAGMPLDGSAGENPMRWAFHFDDEPTDVVDLDMGAGPLPPWRSSTVPAAAGLGVTPGQIASEAASVAVPVFLGVGERDVVPDPWLEPVAYRSSTDVTVYVCPRMAHMHNFASTRRRLWQRLHHWGQGVASGREA